MTSTSTKPLGSFKGLALLLPLFLWLLATVVHSSPLAIPDNEIEIVKRTPFPSLQQCKDAFKAPPKDEALYFTGLPTVSDWNKIKKYATDHGLVHVGNSYPDGWTESKNYQGTKEEEREWQKNFCKLYADATKGTAYLVKERNFIPAKDSIFDEVEAPALKNGGNVDEIVLLPFKHLPDDPKKEKELWWKKA